MERTHGALLGLHLGLAAVGPGMLTLPYALSNLGLFAGTIALFASFSVSLLSCVVIYDSACYVAFRDRIPPPPSYGFLVHQLLNRKWQVLLDLALVVSGFGATVSFLIFLGDFVPNAFRTLVADDGAWYYPFLADRSSVIIVVSVLCTILATTDNGVSHPVLSLIPLLGFLLCMGCLLYRYLHPWQSGLAVVREQLLPLKFSAEAFADINLYLFAFMMQANVLPTFAATSPVKASRGMIVGSIDSVTGEHTTLANYTRKLGTLKRSTFLKALLVSQGATCLYYGVLSVVGVLLSLRGREHSRVGQNFTRDLSPTDPVYVFIRADMIVCLIILSPYLFSAVANGMMNLCAVLRGLPLVQEGFGSFWQRLTYSAMLVLMSAVTALRTDRVATVLTVFGGWGATILMCTFPAVLLVVIEREISRATFDVTLQAGLLRAGAPRRRRWPAQRVLVAYFIVWSVIGLVASVLPATPLVAPPQPAAPASTPLLAS